MTFSPDPKRPLEFLQSCPAYKETPLLKRDVGNIKNVWIKDETSRMGMGAFKAIGGIYAVARLIQDHWKSKTGKELSAIDLLNPEVQEFASDMTFVCASAGNHGLAVATGARLFGAKSRIYLAHSVPTDFEDRLNKAGADVVRSGDTYDESVAAALADTEETGDLLLADGSWEGYTYPPSLVMEGYTVIAEEMRQVFEENNQWPTHVFLQAGVGGLAAAITHMIRNTWAVQPKINIVEPTAAPCLKESQEKGRLVVVTGPESNMGRLDCKVASLICLQVLMQSDVEYLTVTDEEAQLAVSKLTDSGFDTTPSGAAGFAGLLSYLSDNPLSEVIKPLVFLTECSVG